jgi:4-amino-4-deoxy-L-arabinose transferase-like glycosyltransferase
MAHTLSLPGSSSPPRSVSSWLAFFWSHVLFPGTAAPVAHAPGEPGCRPLALVLLLVLPALLLYPGLAFPLLEPDESRYAQIPREMLERGDLVVPTLQGEPYLDKPPLFYWLVVVSYRLFGISDWAARLVPALCLHLTVLVVYLLGRRSLGEPAAFRGAVVLALAPAFSSIGRLLLLDGLLTLWTTVALFAAFEATRGDPRPVAQARMRRGWWLLAAVACALGILTKGPIALVLLAPPLVLQRWLTGRGCRVGRRDLLLFGLVVALLTLPWYVALAVRIPTFVRYFFWEHHVLRYLASFAHQRGFWFYAPVLLVGMLPGSLLAWGFVRFLLSSEETNAARRTPELGFFLLAGGWCVLFFTLSSCKLPTYIMPAFPPLALALGYYLAHSPWRRSCWPVGLAALAFLVLTCFHAVVLPWYAAYRSPLGHDGSVRRLCSDPATPVVCYPRDCNAISFYLGRSDVRSYRSKEIEDLRDLVRSRPRVVILCTHRNSLEGLGQLLPPEVKVADSVHLGLPDIPGVPKRWMKPLKHLLGRTALGLGDVAVVQRR